MSNFVISSAVTTALDTQMISGTMYVPVNALSRVIFTLPINPQNGDQVEVDGYGGGGWQVNIGGASQFYIANHQVTSNIQSGDQRATVILRCVSSILGGQWLAISVVGSIIAN